MQIMKDQRPEKFEHPVGLVYYARYVTDAERNAPIIIPSKEEYDNLCGYEPKIGAYSNWDYAAWAENYRICAERELETLRKCTYTIMKAAIERKHWDEQIAAVEQREDFCGWLVK
jgi:hypothetical protein